MENIRLLLENVPDSYTDFVAAMLHYVGQGKEREQRLCSFLKKNSGAKTSEVLSYVMSFPDFSEELDTSIADTAVSRIA